MSEPWKQVLLVESHDDGEWYPWEMAGERRDNWDRYDDNPTFRIRRFVPEDALAAERARAERAEAELAKYKLSDDDLGPCARCGQPYTKWELLGVSEQKHDVCYALDRAEAAEGREARLREEHRDCRLALEFRDGASCGGVRRDGVCHNHTIIAAMRKHAEDADRFELVLRAAHGIIHEGLHGGKTTDPNHQAQCEKPACKRIRAALAGTPGGEP